MKDEIDDRVRDLLREAAPPVDPAPLERDLWPAVSARLHARRVRVTALDWAIAAALLALLLLFPRLISGLLYHL